MLRDKQCAHIVCCELVALGDMNRQILLWAIVVALAAASAPGSKVRSASAPLYTSAYYEQQVNTSTYYSQGCALGTQARNYQIAQNVLSALDLGRPIVQNGQYGTSHFVVNAFASTSTIQNAVVEFAHGFWVCTGSDITAHLRIAVGTNNYLMDGWTNTQMSAHGQAWSAMATSINNTIASRGYSSQVDASGAGDFEPSWSTYARPDFWIAGYASAYQWPTYDFGSADGCPHSGTQTSTARSCNNGWTQASVRWLSYGSPPTYAVPESYTTNGVQASQWYYISKYQTLAFGYRIYFSGVLTQSGACAQRGGCSGTNNSPSQGYLQLYNDINSDSATSGNITWSLDIRWDS